MMTPVSIADYRFARSLEIADRVRELDRGGLAIFVGALNATCECHVTPAAFELA